MSLRNSSTSYGWIAKFFHWSMVLGFLIMFPLGYYMTGLPLGPDMFEKIALHKSIGAIVLFLAVLRLAWRVINPTPELPVEMTWFERLGAHGVHIALYGVMFVMPLSGWAMSSAANFPLSVFGWFTLPALMEPSKEAVDFLKDFHEVMAVLILVLIALHVGAALKHHFINRDDVLKRMLTVVAVFLIASPAFATDWSVNKDSSKLGFIATQTGAEFEGAFKSFTSTISFDPNNLEDSHVEIIIDIDSVDTQSADRDNQIVSADWFDATAHPKAIFKTIQILKNGNVGYIAKASLNMRGIIKEVDLPFNVEMNADQAHATGELAIQRNDFGIGQGQWVATTVVGDDVRIFFDLKADKK
ncbi:MAG: cytochrome b/b6 domain-containing protein [Terasakiella sp.]|uniref:cytochrome b/b6 domain-containing protein n=1 Tax=unclassified Terasakiella TaxID=2614952 RepID=UPI003B001642